MPELTVNIASLPPSARMFESIPQSTTTEDPSLLEQRLASLSLTEMRLVMLAEITNLKRENPELAESIDEIAPELYGLVGLNPALISGRGVDHEARVESAAMQQRFTHAIVAAQDPEAPEAYVNRVHSMVVTAEMLASRMDREAPSLPGWWKGVRTEVAIAKSLKSSYRVLLPNYTPAKRLPSGKLVGGGAVLEMDVNGGVDMIAISEGASYAAMVDAKTSHQQKPRCEVYQVNPQFEKISPNLLDTLEGPYGRNIVRAIIHLPGRIIQGLGKVGSPRERLQQFGSLNLTRHLRQLRREF